MLTGATAQGTRLRTNPHYHGVYFFLTPYAVHWKDIGTALGFLPNELSMIQSNPMLMMQGATGYLGEMLTKWLQRAPGDGRGSRNFATFEELHDALLKVPGVASIAYDLGQALGKQKIQSIIYVHYTMGALCTCISSRFISYPLELVRLIALQLFIAYTASLV